MHDPISRQAAIAVADSTDYVGLSVADVKKVTDEVVKGLKQLPSVQPKQRNGEWISFNERLPQIDINVLVNVCATDAPYKVVLMSASSAREHYKKANINAWMPLPEPYKGEER